MSFPNVVWGDYGDHRTAQSTKIGGLPLGTKMILPDGSEFVHCKAGGTALSVGYLVQTEDTVDDHDTNRFAGVAGSIGDTTVTLTLGGTSAVTEDQYEDGYLYINDNSGQGYIYRVKENNSAAVSTDCKFTLEDGDSLQLAHLADTTECGLRVNPYKNVLKYEAGTIVGQVVGLPPVAVTANYYFWCQKKGPAMGLVDGAHVLGEALIASSAVDGALAPAPDASSSAATIWEDMNYLGWCMAVQASTDYGPVNLTIE